MNSGNIMRAFLPLLIVLSSAACISEGNEPIRLLGAVSLRGDAQQCTPDVETYQVRGAFDVSMPVPYLVGFRWESALQPLVEQVGADTISSASRNDFFGERVVLRYKTSPSISPRLNAEMQPVLLILRAGELDAWFSFNSLLSPQVIERLASSVEPGQTLNMEVELEVEGRLGSGQLAKSNPVVFPLTIFNSGFSGCAAGLELEQNGPCGRVGGQDNFPIRCVPVSP